MQKGEQDEAEEEEEEEKLSFIQCMVHGAWRMVNRRRDVVERKGKLRLCVSPSPMADTVGG